MAVSSIATSVKLHNYNTLVLPVEVKLKTNKQKRQKADVLVTFKEKYTEA